MSCFNYRQVSSTSVYNSHWFHFINFESIDHKIRLKLVEGEMVEVLHVIDLVVHVTDSHVFNKFQEVFPKYSRYIVKHTAKTSKVFAFLKISLTI